MSENDLIAEYFTRNLEQAEDAALATLLESSPEAAERFAALAQQDYLRLGLPQPVAPNPLLRHLKFGGLGLLALATLFWWWNLPTQTVPLAVAVAVQPDREVRLAPPAQHRIHARARMVHEDLAPRGADQAAGAGAMGSPRLAIGMRTPQGPFDVAVTGGPAQPVGVFDSAGDLVGRLQPSGPQAWLWDAKTRDGKPAGPGRYRICLSSGGRSLRQWVEIERR